MTYCAIKGCANSIPETIERYICRNHPRKDQVEVVRQYDVLEDHKDEEARFQLTQFGEPKNDELYKVGLDKMFHIVKVRTHDEVIPEWAVDDEEIKKLLLRAFPNLVRSETQRQRASVWAQFIYLYFKLKYTDGQIADVMNISLIKVCNIRDRVYRVKAGLTANGRIRKK